MMKCYRIEETIRIKVTRTFLANTEEEALHQAKNEQWNEMHVGEEEVLDTEIEQI